MSLDSFAKCELGANCLPMRVPRIVCALRRLETLIHTMLRGRLGLVGRAIYGERRAVFSHSMVPISLYIIQPA